MSERKDVCYGPLAAGQWFMNRITGTLAIYRIAARFDDIEGLFVCETWSMNQNQDGWIFSKDSLSDGLQLHARTLSRMERVSALKARHTAEQELRLRDDEWRKQWAPDREPLRVVRCTCGVSDDSERERHATGCFLSGEDW